jgi:lipopolysaccharide transport system permease protein
MPTDHPYALVLFCGLFPWLIFSSTLLGVSNSILTNASLIKKVYFPRLIAPLVSLSDKAIDIGVGLVILTVLLLVSGVPIGPQLIYAFVYVAWAVLLGLAIGLWLAWISVLARDIGHALPMMLQVLFYLSPVVYPTQAVPEPYRSFFALNPVVSIIDGMRWSVLGAGSPPGLYAVLALAITALLLVGGLAFFRRAEAVLIDIL